VPTGAGRAPEEGFFEPFHIDLQLADLLEEPVALRFPFRGCAVLTLTKTAGNAVRACFFRSLIWLAWTSSSEAYSVAVFYPLIAAMATWASKSLL